MDYKRCGTCAKARKSAGRIVYCTLYGMSIRGDFKPKRDCFTYGIRREEEDVGDNTGSFKQQVS